MKGMRKAEYAKRREHSVNGQSIEDTGQTHHHRNTRKNLT
jgi:hypothetical protein